MDQEQLKTLKRRYGIVGQSKDLEIALDKAIQVAPIDLSVLIQGESGVGKEVIPRIIHENSPRRRAKYISINCGSIPEGTIDSELFGHEKGAFTGAIGEREGYFGAANGGTLFLDEVGELPLSTQARLLRVLETGEYIRVGSSEVRKTDVRIVAATNVNLQKAISERKFREDLYYRLAAIPISLPPLRERGNDIILLFRKFTNDFTEKYRLNPIELTDDARELLLQYKWPGNIRQLKNVADQISLISKERQITADILRKFNVTNDTQAGTGLVLFNQPQGGQGIHSYENEREGLLHILTSLKQEVQDLKKMMQQMRSTPTHDVGMVQAPPQPHQYVDEDFGTVENIPTIEFQAPNIIDAEPIPMAETYVEPVPRSMREMEEQSIREALKRNNGNRGKTARELGISERTLYRKIRTYEIDVN